MNPLGEVHKELVVKRLNPKSISTLYVYISNKILCTHVITLQKDSALRNI